MTDETYYRASNILDQITHIDKVLALIFREYKCEPPTRVSGIQISRPSFGERQSDRNPIDLNEGEVVAICAALEATKESLKQEFYKL